ncbi:pentapeptide repeat-containing protein [Methanocorpusculum sp. GPch4]|uniref:pentapeptide repeat-containing protein n=1 Tax=Methanocorpusculum sp. GPch4 TaxID=2527877 RepID=UPI001ADE78C5|nr:pentapeptide repeat-containing protein [Methanocorpusculum sp. GPch4]
MEWPIVYNKELYEIISYDYLIKCAKNKRILEWNHAYEAYLKSEWEKMFPDERYDLENIGELFFEGSYFVRPDYVMKDFRKAIQEGVKLTGLHLEGASFYCSRLEGACFSEAHLEGTDFSYAHLEGTDFSYAHLEEADFEEAHLEEVDFEEGHLEEADFEEGHLKGANFSNAHLENANFLGAHLMGANFYNAHLESANFLGAHLEDADFPMAHLGGVDFSNKHLEGAIFSYAHLERVNFLSTHLEGAIFSYAHLEETDLRSAYLEGTDFSYAHLEGANFDNAHLEGAKFILAIFNGETLFNDNLIDTKTDFTGTSLSSARIYPELRTQLERNIRQLRWTEWYNKSKLYPILAKIKNPNIVYISPRNFPEEPEWYMKRCWVDTIINAFVRTFWRISDYGSSTKRIIAIFFSWNILWAVIYYYLLPFLPGTSTTVLNVSNIWAAILQTNLMMFSITDLATEGLDILPMFFVTIHIVVGYFILAALITRLGIMFQNLSP